MIWTIGYAGCSIEEFAETLKAAGVRTLIDVRAIPCSKRNPMFNADELAFQTQRGRLTGIEYIMAGNVLGGPHCHPGGLTRNQRHMLDSVPDGACLLCAEKRAEWCHRGLVLAQYLHNTGKRVTHLYPGFASEAHSQLLIHMTRQGSLFDDAEQQITDRWAAIWEEKYGKMDTGKSTTPD